MKTVATDDRKSPVHPMANSTARQAVMKSQQVNSTGVCSSSRTASGGLHCRPIILNLGCGTKTSDLCINIDWSIYTFLTRIRWALPMLAPIVGHDRVERIRAMHGKIMSHDLRRGIPFPDESVDAVYHSHLMEHVDRDSIAAFQAEIYRVLKPGGLQRICVPDLEPLVWEYTTSLEADDLTRESARRHDITVANMLEQCVRRAPAGTRGQSRFRIWCEGLLLGDARARGETHQWMWDKVNIRIALLDAGFSDVNVRSWETSNIAGWKDMGLERTGDGDEYKPKSLYVECMKPIPTVS
jgi:SAM-dependent methyltransferase